MHGAASDACNGACSRFLTCFEHPLIDDAEMEPAALTSCNLPPHTPAHPCWCIQELCVPSLCSRCMHTFLTAASNVSARTCQGFSLVCPTQLIPFHFNQCSCSLATLSFNPTDSPSTFAQQLQTDTFSSLNIDAQTVAYTLIFAST